MVYFIFKLLCFYSILFQDYSSDISVKLMLTNKAIIKRSDLYVSLCIINNDKINKALVPKHLDYDDKYGRYSPNPVVVIWSLEKVIQNKYLPVKADPMDRGLPLFYPPYEMYDTLLASQSVKHVFQLPGFYTFEKGNYRLKAKLNVQSTSQKFSIVSNWIYFTVDAKYDDRFQPIQ